MHWPTLLFVTAAVVVLILIARLINQWFIRERLTEALTARDNAALGVALAGYVFGVLLIIADVLTGPAHEDWKSDALWVAVYGIAGIFFLAFVATIELRLLLSSDVLASVRQGNVAGGIASGACYVATAQIIAATVSGENVGGTWTEALAFFVIGQITLLFVTYVFRLLTAYNDADEIRKGNIAASVSYAGLLIAVSIIVGNAVRGDFVDYPTGLVEYGKALLVVAALYPVRQFLVQGLLLGCGYGLYGGRLDEEIGRDRNAGAAVIEAVAYIAAALLSARMI